MSGYTRTRRPPSIALRLANALVLSGFDAALGTPCGILAPLYKHLEKKAVLHTVPREDNALALAAGLSLAGRTPMVLMQNSGFAHSLNVLASLIIPYEIPLLLIVSLRGTDGDTTPENRTMGKLTEWLLAELGVHRRSLATTSARDVAHWAYRVVHEEKHIAAITVASYFWRCAGSLTQAD